MRSVRIDNAYRGIVLKPETGRVYVLPWVDHHDKAYQWAKNRICNIHPETGSLQIIDVEVVQAVQLPEKNHTGSLQPGLFDSIQNRDLLQLGVPEVLLPLIRNLKTEEELDQVADRLPQEVYEALFFLAAGYSMEEVLQEMERSQKPAAVDTEDYLAALENADSKRRFFVVEGDLELAAILNAPLEKWRVFLHPSSAGWWRGIGMGLYVYLAEQGPVKRW